MLKLLKRLLLPVTAAFFIAAPVFAGEITDICINGEYIKTDGDVFVREGITFAPMRSLCEALGAKVSWENERASAEFSGGAHISVSDGSKTAVVSGKQVLMNAACEIIDGRTYVPVRFLAETGGFDVDWDSLYRCVTVTKSGVSVPQEYLSPYYGRDELMWLSRIIYAEASGEPFIGQIAVGNVVLNRVASNAYPNTIYGVIFDCKNGVQFEPVINGSVYNNSDVSCIQAAKRALRGENHAGGSLFFFNPSVAQSSWISANRTFYTKIGGHEFYL